MEDASLDPDCHTCRFYEVLLEDMLHNKSCVLLYSVFYFMAFTPGFTRLNHLSSFVLFNADFPELDHVLMNLKPNSVSGWDNIRTHFLKLAKFFVAPVLCKLANLCFAKGVFPKLLKQAIVTPVPKGGERDNVNNYRPISVLPVISKVIEKLLSTRLTNYFNKFKILSDKQFGFRQGKSTEEMNVMK